MGLTALRDKKTYTDKTKLNPAARDDTLRSKDTKQSKLNSIYIIFTSDTLQCLTVLSTSQHPARDASSCFTADRRLIRALPPPISQIEH